MAELDSFDDATLVGRAADGDQAAFAVLVSRYQAAVLRHIFRLTGDRGTAEDVAQDAFLAAWRRLPTLTRPGAFRSWLYQIATNRSLDLLRRRPPVPYDLTDSGGSAATLVAAGPSPAGIHERRAQLSSLDALLRTLPVDQRAAWTLRELDQLSYEEIATVLSVPTSTVRGRIARARHELAKGMSAWQTTHD